jgi:hypothetical protein
MSGSGTYEILFVLCAITFQLILIIHFSLRKWRFTLAIRYGLIVYTLGILAAGISTLMLMAGVTWYYWMGGFIYLAWGIYGYWTEYVRKIVWRNPIRWSIFGPYITLYLATVMFYWWPLALIDKPLWFIYALLFIISTYLNVSSHKKPLIPTL